MFTLDRRMQGKRRSLLLYWSIRYFMLLLLGVAVVGIAGVYIVQWDARSAQKQGLRDIVRDISLEAARHEGKLPEERHLDRYLDNLALRYGLNNQPLLLIVDPEGQIVQQFPSHPPDEVALLAPDLPEQVKDSPLILRLEPLYDRAPLLAAAHPIAAAGENYGYALYLAPEVNVITLMQKFQVMRLGWLGTMLLCGWVIIYLFTRKLIKPIQETAEAARQVAAGNYQINLSKSYQEKELHELMSSFKEMADRLRLLESLRTQLLAGVTHELKTPVTSISGLIQAVRDEVVSGDEARTFLDTSLKECMRLQRMIEDLLDFNHFASGSIQVVKEPIHLRASVQEMVERWRRGQEQDRITVTITASDDKGIDQVVTDPARLEQILVNLLNNAKAAMHEEGVISLRIAAEDDSVSIHVRDTGEGIAEQERANVFEPFYRGRKKTSQIRGLGLGLPFSRLIARSLGGDLLLAETGPAGSTFTIVLPLASSVRRMTS